MYTLFIIVKKRRGKTSYILIAMLLAYMVE